MAVLLPKQGQIITVRNDCKFRAGTSGRWIKVKKGQQFEVTSPSYNAIARGYHLVARAGKGQLNQGWPFMFELFDATFEVDHAL